MSDTYQHLGEDESQVRVAGAELHEGKLETSTTQNPESQN